MKKHMQKIILGGVWLTIIVVTLVYHFNSGYEITEYPDLIQRWILATGAIGPFVYIIAYTIRPVIFFPATPLSLLSGALFGPVLGIFYTIIGGNLSANFAFFLARYFGRSFVGSKESGFIKKWDQKLCENGIVTVMIMRFIYLPYDAVNFGCGLTSMKQRDFAIGTFIGTLPGLITFVLLGGTISSGASGVVMIWGLDIPNRMIILTLSAVFFVLGLVIAKLVRKYSTLACDVVDAHS